MRGLDIRLGPAVGKLEARRQARGNPAVPCAWDSFSMSRDTACAQCRNETTYSGACGNSLSRCWPNAG
jgi:hypothetical protein